MIPTEFICPGYFNEADAQENNLKSEFMKMIEVLKEEMNKSLRGIWENRNKQWNGIDKTIEGLKIGIESVKKTQTEGILEMKNLGTQTETLETKLTSRIQKEERILGVEDMIGAMDTLVKKRKDKYPL